MRRCSNDKQVSNHNDKRMRRILFFILIIFNTYACLGQKKLNNEISSYVHFLQKNSYSAKEYIMTLWDKYDIVIFCERFHGEVTQYNLLLDIIKDERFISNIGNIYTEIGSITIQQDLNIFLQTNYSNEELRKDQLLNIYRNLTFSPYWEKYNFYHFLSSINMLNNTVQESLKLKIHPLSFEFPGWENFKTSTEYKNWFYEQPNFDSIMAVNFIKQYEIQLKNDVRKKALVILNYRHAFSKDVKNEMQGNSIYIPNTARYIFEKYPQKVANVLLNTWTSLPVNNPDIGDPHVPIQGGKWDASFKYIGIKSMGFDFENSPFGYDTFDLWPYSTTELKYKDFFTGFVFYLPLTEHYELYGIPGLVSSDFREELRRRLEIFNPVWNWDTQGQKSEINKTLKQLNRLQKERYYKLNRKLKLIDKWLN